MAYRSIRVRALIRPLQVVLLFLVLDFSKDYAGEQYISIITVHQYKPIIWSLICAKNTTFIVSFYLRILPSPISNIHLQPSVIRFHPLSAVRNLHLCQKYYLRCKLLPPHSTSANFEHPPSTVRDSLSSTFSCPQCTFARLLSTLGSIRSVQG